MAQYPLIMAKWKYSSLTALLCPCSIKLTAFDTVKTLISTGQKELEKLIQENQENMS
jgi:hypothetical protein